MGDGRGEKSFPDGEYRKCKNPKGGQEARLLEQHREGQCDWTKENEEIPDGAGDGGTGVESISLQSLS